VTVREKERGREGEREGERERERKKTSKTQSFVCRSENSFPTCMRNGHLHRVTYTRGCIDTIDSPDDEHGVARNM
jgi:hypothetical protein